MEYFFFLILREYILNFKNCVISLNWKSAIQSLIYTNNEELFAKISVPVINIRARYLGSSLKRQRPVIFLSNYVADLIPRRRRCLSYLVERVHRSNDRFLYQSYRLTDSGGTSRRALFCRLTHRSTCSGEVCRRMREKRANVSVNSQRRNTSFVQRRLKDPFRREEELCSRVPSGRVKSSVADRD